MKELLIFLLLLLFIENKTITAFRDIKRGFYPTCPKGSRSESGKCIKENERCVGGKVYKNECICPAGRKLKNGKCEKIVEIKGNKIIVQKYY